ncbi:reverse transcriptase domain-containing protein [Tanacetum coccineum]
MDSSTRDKTHKGRPWEGSGKKNRDKRDMFSPYKESNLGILQSLTKSPREILTTKSRKYIHEASQNGVQGKRYIQVLRVPPRLRTLNIGDEIFATEHKLNEDKKITPVQQKKREMVPKRCVAAPNEVEELRKAGFSAKQDTRRQIRRNMEAYMDKKNGGWTIPLKHSIKSRHQGQPAKVKVLTSFKRPKTIKEVQGLNGKLAVLNRFLSKSAKKSLPFFKTIKGCLEKKDFMSTREADKAYEDMKRLARWAIELGEYEIKYKPRNAIKAQVLTKFLAETKVEDEDTDFQDQEGKKLNIGWRLYTDGASSDGGSRARLMKVSQEGMEFTYALKFEFKTTKNKAEYEAVKACLLIAKEMKIEEITVFVDS